MIGLDGGWVWYCPWLQGVISLEGPLDRETDDEYTLTIEAQDNYLAPLSDRRITPRFMTIKIQDVNDYTPIFDNPSYVADNVQENAQVNTQILTVHATDDDLGDNGAIKYFVDSSNSNSSGLFNVMPTSGVVYISELLRGHVGWFVVTIIARDQGVPSLSNSTRVYIFIDDVNDHQPQITQPGNETIYIWEVSGAI